MIGSPRELFLPNSLDPSIKPAASSGKQHASVWYPSVHLLSLCLSLCPICFPNVIAVAMLLLQHRGSSMWYWFFYNINVVHVGHVYSNWLTSGQHWYGQHIRCSVRYWGWHTLVINLWLVALVQGVTVDEARVNSIKKLAEKLITQGRTDTKFIQDKRDSLDDKYELFSCHDCHVLCQNWSSHVESGSYKINGLLHFPAGGHK